MSNQSEHLKCRTMAFALDVCALIRRLPVDEPGPTVKHQLVGEGVNWRDIQLSQLLSRKVAR
jgi:hypothetical protein